MRFQVLPPDQPGRSETNRISKHDINPRYSFGLIEMLRCGELEKGQIIICPRSLGPAEKSIEQKNLPNIQVLKLHHQYLHKNGPFENYVISLFNVSFLLSDVFCTYIYIF